MKLASAWSYVAGAVLILAWIVSGPYFNYSAEWQFAMTAGTSIATFLLVLILQHTEFRQTRTIQLKWTSYYGRWNELEQIWFISKRSQMKISTALTRSSSNCRNGPPNVGLVRESQVDRARELYWRKPELKGKGQTGNTVRQRIKGRF
ncbi:MAG: low affinity iron permease family protein [Deltaproteobacteria bacterium]|nr:low affinity iron permease family protein [Deltaproteobacteria bacterium]